MSEEMDGRATVPSFDHHSPDMSVDPWPAWKKLRDYCPATWTEQHGGYWVLTDYQSVWAAFRDDDRFIASEGASQPAFPTRQVPLETDPPLTQKLRRMLAEEFSPTRSKALEPAIYQLANDLIDGFIESGSCDYIVDYANPLSAQIITREIGFEDGMWVELVTWIHKMVHELQSDFDGGIQAALSLYTACEALLEDRRTNGLRDDMASKLVVAELDGEPFDPIMARDYLLLLLFGGLDTTSATLGNALVRLERQPELREELLAHPELIPDAVEEFLRIDSPVQGIARSITADVEMCGQHMKAGERALLSIAAADRDPAEFPDPDTVDFHRPTNRHMAFGVGVHRCLGAPIGRAMFRVMLETVLKRTPDFKLVGNPDDHRFADAAAVYALKELPARFTPGPRLSPGSAGA